MKIFPNPSNDILILQAVGLLKEDVSFTLSDIQGKEITTQKITAGSTIAFFDVSTLYAGTYFVSYSDANGKKTVPVLVH